MSIENELFGCLIDLDGILLKNSTSVPDHDLAVLVSGSYDIPFDDRKLDSSDFTL